MNLAGDIGELQAQIQDLYSKYQEGPKMSELPLAALERHLLSRLTPNADTFVLPHSVGPDSLAAVSDLTAPPVSTLPTAPVDGEVAIYSHSQGKWALKYQDSDAYWYFVGGAPLFAVIDTLQGTAATHTTYQALTTAGPSITVPLAGDYIIEIASFQLHSVADTSQFHSYSLNDGGTAASDTWAATSNAPNTSYYSSASSQRKHTGLTAATAIASMYRSAAANQASFNSRSMSVLPVRVQA